MPAHRLIINLSIMRKPYSQSNVKLSSIHPFPWTTPVYHTFFLPGTLYPFFDITNFAQLMPVMSHHSAIWSFLPFHYCFQPIPAPFPSIFQTTASLVSVHTSPSIKSYHQPESSPLNTIPSSTQTTSCPPFHALPHLVHNWFDSKDTCVKCVLSSQTIHQSIHVFSVLLVPSPTHLYTSSIPTCLYSTTPSPSPCRFIHQLFKVSWSQAGHAPILPPLNPAPCKQPMFITARGLWICWVVCRPWMPAIVFEYVDPGVEDFDFVFVELKLQKGYQWNALQHQSKVWQCPADWHVDFHVCSCFFHVL